VNAWPIEAVITSKEFFWKKIKSPIQFFHDLSSGYYPATSPAGKLLGVRFFTGGVLNIAN
jgi:hypothetical protein